MAKKKVGVKLSIPDEIKKEVLKIVDDYNKEFETMFQATFRTQYCYISRFDQARQLPAFNFFGISFKRNVPDDRIMETNLGRLKWTGNMNEWEFAVYKYSRENYDPDEWFFPGARELDGTVLGVLKLGYTIYPR